MKQKDVISVETYDEVLDRYNKTEYVVLSRDEYNLAVKQVLVCRVIYVTDMKPYFIPIRIPGLRRNSKVNTLNISTLEFANYLKVKSESIGEISNREFLEIAQAVSLNFKFPI